MKKLGLALLAFAMVLGIAACSSTSSATSDEKKQEAINDSFRKVYESYANVLVLDGAETYTVKSGDKLTSIAKEFYGSDNGYFFPIIMLASNEVVQDPELITPGMELTIPNFDANINDTEVATKLKPYFKSIANIYKTTKKDAPGADVTREALLDISEKLGTETFASKATSTTEESAETVEVAE